MKEELVLEILKGEKITATLANVVTKLAISANAHAKETNARITTLWPSIEKQLQAQMAFSKNLKHGRCQKQLQRVHRHLACFLLPGPLLAAGCNFDCGTIQRRMQSRTS